MLYCVGWVLLVMSTAAARKTDLEFLCAETSCLSEAAVTLTLCWKLSRLSKSVCVGQNMENRFCDKKAYLCTVHHRWCEHYTDRQGMHIFHQGHQQPCRCSNQQWWQLLSTTALFVVVNERHKRHVVSLLSWQSLPIPRTEGSCPEVEKKDWA